MTLGFSHAGGYYTTGRHLEEGGHLLTLSTMPTRNMYLRPKEGWRKSSQPATSNLKVWPTYSKKFSDTENVHMMLQRSLWSYNATSAKRYKRYIFCPMQCHNLDCKGKKLIQWYSKSPQLLQHVGTNQNHPKKSFSQHSIGMAAFIYHWKFWGFSAKF